MSPVTTNSGEFFDEYFKKWILMLHYHSYALRKNCSIQIMYSLHLRMIFNIEHRHNLFYTKKFYEIFERANQ